MERKTINYYRNELAKGFNETIISDVIKKYGNNGQIRFDTRKVKFHWNHCIDSIGVGKNGGLWLGIYWQGDSTDGTDSVNVSDFRFRNEVVIPASSYFDGYRTRYNHSDIRVSREELNEAVKEVLNYISPESIKARKEYEQKCEVNKKIHNYTGNELYNRYAGGFWSRDERWFNGIHAVDAYFEAHWKELGRLTDERLKEVVKAVFLTNYKYDCNIAKTKPEHSWEKGEKIYDLSYSLA